MMRIKTYTSESVPEALKLIRQEMGPGAVILKTNRTVKKRLWGLVPSLAYEITAASDPAAAEADSALNQSLVPTSDLAKDGVQKPANGAPKESRALDTYEVAETPPRERPAARSSAKATQPASAPGISTRLDTCWVDQFNRLSDEIQSVLRLVSHQRAHDAISTLFLKDGAVAESLQELIWQGEFQGEGHRQAAYAEFQKLILEGVEESLAFVLIRDVFRNLPPDEDASERLRIRLNKAISKLARTAPIDLQDGPRACIFVGPTGVGKTTTIAKLAARFSLKNRRSVKLLTVDTYRIAAAEQLRTYGDIIGIPVKVIYSIDELDREVRNAGPQDTLLIDTTGHSHKRISEYHELSDYVRSNEKIGKHLVLSCTTRQEDLREIVACFGVFRPERLVFTKLDEASSFGMILNEAVRADRPISYLTNGQDVAGDLILPTPATLADLLVPLA